MKTSRETAIINCLLFNFGLAVDTSAFDSVAMEMALKNVTIPRCTGISDEILLMKRVKFVQYFWSYFMHVYQIEIFSLLRHNHGTNEKRSVYSMPRKLTFMH